MPHVELAYILDASTGSFGLWRSTQWAVADASITEKTLIISSVNEHWNTSECQIPCPEKDIMSIH
jgi:hypothetical protein